MRWLTLIFALAACSASPPQTVNERIPAGGVAPFLKFAVAFGL